MHIGVAGNIGSGKTTLTRLLAEHYGWTPKYEAVTYNPYLEDYYRDIPRWSYNLETYFLAQRFKDVLEISKSEDVIIQDRTILEGVHIFVANNFELGNLSKRDYDTYMQLFNLMMSMVRLPDLLIYLRASVPHLVEGIRKRGRDYEQSISLTLPPLSTTFYTVRKSPARKAPATKTVTRRSRTAAVANAAKSAVKKTASAAVRKATKAAPKPTKTKSEKE